jgi:protoheme IX farnesyltransferase
MPHESLATNPRPLWRTWLVVLALLAYVLILTGAAWTTSLGDVLSSVALLVLGTAVSWLALARTTSTSQRLGGRAQALWKRERALALLGATSVYVTLVFGSLVTKIGGLWTCTTLPFCGPLAGRATLTLVHRGFAAMATLLVIALAIQALRSHHERAVRRAAFWAIRGIVAQNIVGVLLVLTARGNEPGSLTFVRLAHLAVGASTWSAVAVLATLVVRVPPSKTASVRDIAAHRGAQRPSLLWDYVSLTKPGVITLLIFTTLAAMFITPAGVPSLSLLGWTMLGGWLMPAGAHALNCYFDRDIDGKMGRTGRRPIPSGRIPAWHALVLGLGLGALAFVIFARFVNLLTAVLALAGYVYYVVLYTIVLKRNSVHNIVIGGGAGAIPPLVGWAAASGSLTWTSLLLFAVIFYWTPPHFWALALIRQKDYANAGVPMLPVVAGDARTKRQILIYSAVMIGLSLLLTPFHLMGRAYIVMAAVLGLIFLGYVLGMIRNDSTATRWALYRFSLLYLFLLFVAMMVDRLVFA